MTRSTGFVNGNLKKQYAGSGAVSRTFEVGTGTTVAGGVYSPVTVALAGVAGTDSTSAVTASATASDHPNIATSAINGDRDVNRYWTLTKSGNGTFSSYTPTFTFVSGDLDAVSPVVDTANLIVRKFDAPSTWTSPPGGSSSTATTATGTNFTSMSSFAVGEPGVATLEVTGFTSPTTAGVPGSVTVTAKNIFGNTFTGYTGTVGLTSTDSRATLPGAHAFLAGENGTHTFTGVTLNSTSPIGGWSITATDPTSTATGTQSAITVNPAPLTVTVDPQTKVYGQANPAFTLVASGLIGGDSAATATAGVSCTTTVATDATSSVGDLHDPLLAVGPTRTTRSRLWTRRSRSPAAGDGDRG